MAKKRHPRARVLGKRAENYKHKLKILRLALGSFDARRYDTALASKPRSDSARRARKQALDRVSRTYARLKPYVDRGVKFVRVKDPKRFESLRRVVGVVRFKRMRAVPVPTQAKRLTVKFDRTGRPTISEDGVKQKIFLFPHVPRSRVIHERDGSRRLLDAQEDAVSMLKDMLPSMPEGFYILMTRHHFLIPYVAEKDRLEKQIRTLYNKYEGTPELLKIFVGVRYITDSEEEVLRIKKELSSERERLKGARRRARIGARLKEIIAMDKQLKSGKPLSRGQISRRARITGRR